MEVDLPGLAQRVGLDEVALVVHVEPVVDGVILQVGDEAGHVDDGHEHKPATSRHYGGPAVTDPVLSDAGLIALLDATAAAVVGCAGRGARLGPRRHAVQASTTATSLPTRPRSRCSCPPASACSRGEWPARPRTRRSSWWSTRSTGRPTPLTASPGTPREPLRGRRARPARRAGRRTSRRASATKRRAVAGRRATASRSRPSAATRLGDVDRRACRATRRRRLGWKQYRALGAVALDLCAVASGRLDAFVDCSRERARTVGLPRRHARLPRGRRGRHRRLRP